VQPVQYYRRHGHRYYRRHRAYRRY